MQGQTRKLEQLASDLYALAAEVAIPSRTARRSKRLVAEDERIADGVRAVVRNVYQQVSG